MSRIRIYSLPQHTVLDHFQAASKGYKFLSLPRLQLPEGYELLDVREDWLSRSFQFKVSHPSFDEVPVGERYPEFGLVGVEWERVEIKRPDSLAELVAEGEKLGLYEVPKGLTNTFIPIDGEQLLADLKAGKVIRGPAVRMPLNFGVPKAEVVLMNGEQ